MAAGLRSTLSLSLLSALVLVLTGGCADSAQPREAMATASQAVPTPSAKPLRTLSGPKRSIAVGKFDSIGSFSQEYGDWDIGGGLAAMLTTSLEQSKQFIVLDRSYTVQLMNEHALKQGGMLTAETAPQKGRMLGVQLLIYGAVTEFGTKDKGRGLSLGFGGGSGQGGPLSAALGRTTTSGAVSFDLRIVDANTGQVVQTVTEREEISSSHTTLSGGYRGMELGSERFWDTPLGEATRRAIDRAVGDIVAAASKRPWQGQVVDVDGNEVAINAGSNAGVKLGDRFFIEHPVKQLTDASTGELLSVRRQRLGHIEVTAVEEKLATGKYVALVATRPVRGDVVIQDSQ